MSTLTGRKIQDTYKQLLQIDVPGGLDGTLRDLESGDGVVSPLQLSTAACKIQKPLTIDSGTAADNLLTIKGASSQSGDYFRIQDSNGDSYFRFKKGANCPVEFYLTHINAGFTHFIQIVNGGSGVNDLLMGYSTGDLNYFNIKTGQILQLSGTNHDGARECSVLITTPAASARALVTKAFASQSVSIQEWRKSDDTVYSRVSQNGYFTTKKVAAPADAELSASEVAFWFDDTNGAAKFKIKGKSADGTVVTGEVTLA